MRKLILLLIVLCFISPAYAVRGINNERGIIAEANGGLPVNIQDQTTPPFFIKANNVIASTTLGAQASVGDRVISVTSAAGIIVGHYLGIFNTTTDRFYAGTVLSISVNDLTMDTLVDSQFEVGDVVGAGITNLASIDGSAAVPVIFAIRGADPGIDVTIDITRIIITCIADTAVDLSKFGDIVGGLTNGLVMRRTDGITQNYINWKTNQEIAGSMYDWEVYSKTNPVQGVDGFAARLTFGGQSKLGVVIRLGPGEELEFVVQDPLNTLLLNFLEIMVEGHVVTD